MTKRYSLVDGRSSTPQNRCALCGSQMCGSFRCLMDAKPYPKMGLGVI